MGIRLWFDGEKARSLGFARDDCGFARDDPPGEISPLRPQMAAYGRNDGVGRQNIDGTYGVRNWHFVGWLAIFRSRVASWASMTSAAATYVAS